MPSDPVNHPDHYTEGGIETIDYIEAKGFNYHLGNAIKYISRAGLKEDEIEDIKKAIWYLNRYLNKCKTSPSQSTELEGTSRSKKSHSDPLMSLRAQVGGDWMINPQKEKL